MKPDSIFNRFPMAVKMIFIMMLIAIAAGVFFQWLESGMLKKIFVNYLLETLDEKASENRRKIAHYMNEQTDSIKLLAGHPNLHVYLNRRETANWAADEEYGMRYYRKPPPWFPSKKIVKIFVRPYLAMLLDPHNRVREIFQWSDEPAPQTLLNPSGWLPRLIHHQSIITNIEGIPFLLVAEEIYDSPAKRRAIIIFAWPLDSDFLLNSQGALPGAYLVLLVDEHNRVFASTNEEVISSGTLLESLMDKYLVLGKVTEKTFYPYGENELDIRNVSLVLKSEIENLTNDVLSIGLRRTIIYSAVFLIASVGFVFLLSLRIRMLTGRITWFLHKTLGIEHRIFSSGDEFSTLLRSFIRMEEKIIESRDALNLHMKELRDEKDRAQHYLVELKQTQARLIQSGKMSAIGELAAGVAHELNNPLSGVLTYAVLLKEKFNRAPESTRAHFPDFSRQLDIISVAAERTKTIVDNLLEFSRQSESVMEEVQIEESLQKALELIRAQLRHNNIEVHKDIQPGLPLVRANGNQLQQVFINIIINAMHVMENGGEISIQAVSRAKTCDVSISDTGPGIPKENLDRIFEPFFTTKEVGKGTGLGLSIVYGIIQKLGGEIMVDSEEGQGTTFCIKLPLVSP